MTTHWTAAGRCFPDLASARRWAAAEIERTERRAAHPVLVDAAVLRCPEDETCPRAPTWRDCVLAVHNLSRLRSSDPQEVAI